MFNFNDWLETISKYVWIFLEQQDWKSIPNCEQDLVCHDHVCQDHVSQDHDCHNHVSKDHDCHNHVCQNRVCQDHVCSTCDFQNVKTKYDLQNVIFKMSLPICL